VGWHAPPNSELASAVSRQTAGRFSMDRLFLAFTVIDALMAIGAWVLLARE
jgi:hypothetical protein